MVWNIPLKHFCLRCYYFSKINQTNCMKRAVGIRFTKWPFFIYTDGDVRLSRGDNSNSPYDGIVQVYNDGNWGGVCSSNFAIEEATVVCRALGYKMATRTVNAQDIYPNHNNTAVTVNSLSCSGYEYRVQDCYGIDWEDDDFFGQSCSARDVAAVVCSPIAGR